MDPAGVWERGVEASAGAPPKARTTSRRVRQGAQLVRAHIAELGKRGLLLAPRGL